MPLWLGIATHAFQFFYVLECPRIIEMPASVNCINDDQTVIGIERLAPGIVIAGEGRRWFFCSIGYSHHASLVDGIRKSLTLFGP